MNIGIIGAGNVGGNLGVRLAKSGFAVRFGLKDGKDAGALLARAPGAAAATVEDAAKSSDVLFLAVPGNVAVDVARSLAGVLAGKVVVDCNNALTWKDGPVWSPPAEGSLAQAIAKAAPGAKVVKAFNTFGAEHHLDPGLTGAPATVFMAADDAGAKKTVAEIASKAGFDPVDAGPLRNAGVLENVAILWIHLASVGGKGRGVAIHLRGG
jgi:predicted dinucleotide-binding enzyme